MSKFAQTYEKLKENEALLEKEMGLQLPPKLDPIKDFNEIVLWKEYYFYLKKAYKYFLLDKELVPVFEEKFFKLKTEKEKRDFIIRFSTDLDEKIQDSQEGLDIFYKIKTEDAVEKTKATLPKILQPIFEYVAYSIFSGQPIDPEIEELLEAKLSPKDLENLQQADYYQTLNEIRRNPLNAREFNKAFNSDSIAAYIDQNFQAERVRTLPNNVQNNTTPNQNYYPQPVQPRNNFPQPNQQRVSQPQQFSQQKPQVQQIPQQRQQTRYQNPQQVPVQRRPQQRQIPNPKANLLPNIQNNQKPTGPRIGRRVKGLGDLTK